MIKESREELEGYITSNNITVTPLESGIYIVSKEKEIDSDQGYDPGGTGKNCTPCAVGCLRD